MTLDFKDDNYRDFRDVENQCKKYLFYHIVLTMADGKEVDGIIENVDSNGITMLVGKDIMEKEDENQSNGQRQYYHDNRPRRRFRRFDREYYPLNTLGKIALLSYIAPYAFPYPYPPFPYYQYYPYY